ncbi:MAG: hypothetical protein R3C11_28260 [Planctomycetaceae bacterium]
MQNTLKRVQFYKYELDGLHLSHQLSKIENRILREILGSVNIHAYIDSLFTLRFFLIPERLLHAHMRSKTKNNRY